LGQADGKAGARRNQAERRKTTREALINASLRLIADKGIDATSVLDVTQAAGISNGAFYYHFQNKDQLLEEVGHALVANLIARIGSVQRKDPAAQVSRGTLIMMRYFEAHPRFRAIMPRVIEDLDDRHANLREQIQDDLMRGRDMGRFVIADVEVAVRFCCLILASALRQAPHAANMNRLADLAAIHMLAMLGVPSAEAALVVAGERAMIESND
jgi:AcrR family transcriptional regulator